MNTEIVTPEEREMCRIAPDSFTAETVRLRLALLHLAKSVNKGVVTDESVIRRLKFVAKALR